VPDFWYPGVGHAEGEVVRAAHVAQVIKMLVGPPHGEHVIAPGAKACAVVPGEDGGPVVAEAGRGGTVPVDASFAEYLLDAGMIEGIVAMVDVANLIEMQGHTGSMIERLAERLDESRTDDGVGVHDAGQLAARKEQPRVIHQMLVIIDVVGNFQDQPRIYRRRFSRDPGFFEVRLDIGRSAAVILNPDDLKHVSRDVLLLQVSKNMITFPTGPVQQDERNSGALYV